MWFALCAASHSSGARLNQPGRMTTAATTTMGQRRGDAVPEAGVLRDVADGNAATQGGVSLDLPAVWAYDGDGPLSPSKPLPAMYLQMDQDFGIPSGEARINGRVVASPVLRWEVIPARFKPLADAPR